MAYLSSCDESFAEVVAVDASLELFGRAWCIAELAGGQRMGMAQSLKLRNKAGRFLVLFLCSYHGVGRDWFLFYFWDIDGGVGDGGEISAVCTSSSKMTSNASKI